MSVELYVLRHGIAEGIGGEVMTDDERRLTAEGRKKTREVVRGFLALKPRISAVYTSPLVRAVQTAEILVEECETMVPLIKTNTLLNGAPFTELFLTIEAETPKAEEVVVVGHEPYLSNMISRLTFGLDRGTVDFRKAGMAQISLDCFPPRELGILRWIAPPALLRKAGKDA